MALMYHFCDTWMCLGNILVPCGLSFSSGFQSVEIPRAGCSPPLVTLCLLRWPSVNDSALWSFSNPSLPVPGLGDRFLRLTGYWLMLHFSYFPAPHPHLRKQTFP